VAGEGRVEAVEVPKTLKSLKEEGREGREADRNASKGRDGKLPGREGKLNGKEGGWLGRDMAGEGILSIPAGEVMSSMVRLLPSAPVKGTLFAPGIITGS
jgi:hypothetical protein